MAGPKIRFRLVNNARKQILVNDCDAGSDEDEPEKGLAMQRVSIGLALALAVCSALIYHAGFQEVAATVSFASLVLLMPVLRAPDSPSAATEPVSARSRPPRRRSF
jgi:hypothetical protein